MDGNLLMILTSMTQRASTVKKCLRVKKQCMEALIQRLAFLSASTHLVNLQKCILEDLHDETKELVLKRKEELLESRAGERTAYVQQRL
jgi:hypothetical protein